MIDDPNSEVKLKLVCMDISDRWKKVRAEYCSRFRLQMRVTHGFRSYSEQWAIYAQGRKKNEKGQWVITDIKKIVTHARGGESLHNFGLAVDIAFMGEDPYLERLPNRNELWKEYGKMCESHGLEWGGNWKSPDRPHCQKTYGLSIGSLQMLYEEKGTKGIFEKCSQIMGCGRIES